MADQILQSDLAGRRAGSVIDYKAVLTKFEPEKSLTVGQRRANGRNHHGVITAKHRGGGNKKLYRIIDFKRRKDDIPANGRRDRIRSEPLVLHRPDPVRGRREDLHPRPQRPEGRHEGHQRPRFAAGPGQLHAAGEHPDRPGNSQHRDEPRPGRQADSLGRRRRPPGCPRRRMGRHHPSVRRNAPRQQRLPGDDRPARQSRLDQRQHRQGRPLAGTWASARTPVPRR